MSVLPAVLKAENANGDFSRGAWSLQGPSMPPAPLLLTGCLHQGPYAPMQTAEAAGAAWASGPVTS